ATGRRRAPHPTRWARADQSSVVHSAAWVPVSDTVAYSSAALISPWVHSDTPTCTLSREASGSTSIEDPYTSHAWLSPLPERVGAVSTIIGPPRWTESSRYRAARPLISRPSSM